MNKHLLSTVVLALVLLTNISFPQEWTGTGTTDPIYRAGNVGIGVSPNTDLHLKRTGTNATFKIENTGDGNASLIEFSRERINSDVQVGGAMWIESNTSNYLSQLFLNTRSANAYYDVVTYGVTPALTIGDGTTNDIRVGIGTITP